MPKFAIKLSGLTTEDSTALSVLGLRSRRSAVLEQLYSIPYELRVVVITDKQLRDFNRAKDTGQINKHIDLRPVNKMKEVDLRVKKKDTYVRANQFDIDINF